MAKYTEEQKNLLYNARLKAKAAIKWTAPHNVNTYGHVSTVPASESVAYDAAKHAATYAFAAFPELRVNDAGTYNPGYLGNPYFVRQKGK